MDQRNIPERNQQVAIMRDIYMQADEAIIWLGEVNADTLLAYKTLYSDPKPHSWITGSVSYAQKA
jgi:hypothetical protein